MSSSGKTSSVQTGLYRGVYGSIVSECVDVGRCVSSQQFPSHHSEVIQEVKRLRWGCWTRPLQLHLQQLPSLLLHVSFCHAVLCRNFSVRTKPLPPPIYPSILLSIHLLRKDSHVSGPDWHLVLFWCMSRTNIWHKFGIFVWHISWFFFLILCIQSVCINIFTHNVLFYTTVHVLIWEDFVCGSVTWQI